jgi:hypothetical protein
MRIELDVTDHAPPGVHHLVGDLFVPAALAHPPIVLTCLPGGGMSRRYFDLDAPGGYSMARHLAAAGFIVLTLDPPAIGESDTPDDGWTLTPPVVATALAHAVGGALAALRAGTLTDELPPLPDLVSIGVGHSAGGLLTCYQQAAHRTHDAVALLGFAGCGMPLAITGAERAYSDDPERLRADLHALAAARFDDPLPPGTTADSDYLIAVPIPNDVRASIARSSDRLLGLVGLACLIPGGSAPELGAVDVPVFLGIADHDIIADPSAAPTDFGGSSDVTLFVLRDSGHNHNVAPSRAALWDRIGTWARQVSAS